MPNKVKKATSNDFIKKYDINNDLIVTDVNTTIVY